VAGALPICAFLHGPGIDNKDGQIVLASSLFLIHQTLREPKKACKSQVAVLNCFLHRVAIKSFGKVIPVLTPAIEIIVSERNSK